MNITATITQLKQRRDALTEAIAALEAVAKQEGTTTTTPTTVATTRLGRGRKGNKLSEEGRARIAEAMRRRWERSRAATAETTAAVTVEPELVGAT